uniref:NADH-ubiquinone oxidoreductase chain 2 n=1 Tax=Lype reducta TaxID=1271732 RepID=A0A7D7ATE3_9NEOP|nr:NADH dehydrogenase subunit 2 [Lype reducta]
MKNNLFFKIFMNSSKMMIILILLMSTIFTFSNNSWMINWMLMEINLFSFIPLLSNKNSFSSESLMKYFFIQTICSLMLFMLIIFMWNKMMNNNMTINLMNLCLIMKLGSAPLHYWFIQIIESLSWMNLFLISTWQKIIPMIMLTYNFNMNLIMLSIYLNSLIGAIGGINQTSLRKILGYSSINHIGWMLASMLINDMILISYLLIYMFMMSYICIMFFNWNINFISQFSFMNNIKLNSMFMMMIFFSLGGLPPFLGFLPKWLTINFLIMNNFIMINLFMILCSLIILYFYLMTMMQYLLFNNIKNKWFLKFNNNKLNFMKFNLLLLTSLS